MATHEYDWSEPLTADQLSLWGLGTPPRVIDVVARELSTVFATEPSTRVAAFRVDAHTLAAVDAHAAEQGISRGDVLRAAVDSYVTFPSKMVSSTSH